ncbi:basic membrane protein A [Carnobacterium iners]|uniref:Basic membrane protein A n=1 Tax=Carnobacterium iners TaxID=1073423 RepID=A0A1X7NIT0_9LACT|nr:BMP family ABC transporter substrate-binding protein [Carnobacterium iners]SEK66478.1 basic membrane protein A [Carnobacterium iners]SMH37742.1 basic membrane protein A [Carnobacterium iners]
MKTNHSLSLIAAGVTISVLLGACGAENPAKASTDEKKNGTVGLAADFSGIDDKSFNQSAWEGLEAWGQKNNLPKGIQGYDYIQAKSASDYVMNLQTLANNKFDTVVAMGFKLTEALIEVAPQYPETNFTIVDVAMPKMDNVASLVFKDNESAFLAGIAAAESTLSNKVGFIGGQQSDIIDKFEAGFVQGVKTVKPEAEVRVEYVNSFADSAKGKAIAAAMYASGIDIIFQAAGDSGNGVFSEAKDLMNLNSENKKWVIGADRDQTKEGVYNSGNVTLTSTLKQTGNAIQDIADKALKGNFPGGEILNYGLSEDGVGLTDGQLSKEIIDKIDLFKQQISNGELVVTEKPGK